MYLAIDLWDKKCGIAIEIQNIVIPKAIVDRVKLISYIKKLRQEYQITKIIVWLPYDLYGICSKQLDKTRKFIEKLEKIFPDISIYTIDERYTTFEAERLTKVVSKNNERKDDISACLILESYLKKIT